MKLITNIYIKYIILLGIKEKKFSLLFEYNNLLKYFSL